MCLIPQFWSVSGAIHWYRKQKDPASLRILLQKIRSLFVHDHRGRGSLACELGVAESLGDVLLKGEVDVPVISALAPRADSVLQSAGLSHDCRALSGSRP